VVNPALPAFPAIGKADVPLKNIENPAVVHQMAAVLFILI
jgi:hypothetical protein